MVLIIGLFLSLLLLFLLLIVPGTYSASPASLTLDYVRRQVEGRLLSGTRELQLSILQKSPGDIVKTGLFIGAGIGLLALLVTLKPLKYFSIPVAVACFIGGLYLTEIGISNEFKRWQAEIFGGIPMLVGFLPSFLEAGGITLREAISHTIPFLPEPLRSEMWYVLDRIRRTGMVRDAFDRLAERVNHPCMDAICLRLSSAWDATPLPDIFDDLADQIEGMKEMAIARATAGKTGLLALICVLGLLGAVLVFGYPGWMYMSAKIGFGFGG